MRNYKLTSFKCVSIIYLGLQEFKNEKFKGRFLNVTVARENFLDKLKREREEAAAKSSGTNASDATNQHTELVSTRPTLPVLATRPAATQSSSEDSSSSSDEDEPTPKKSVAIPQFNQKPTIPDQEVDEDGNLLLRKRSKTFLENGKVCDNFVLLFYCLFFNRPSIYAKRFESMHELAAELERFMLSIGTKKSKSNLTMKSLKKLIISELSL